MISVLYLTALGQGFFGSPHCMGMCGPLVLMVHGNSNSLWKNGKIAFVYNLSRTASYATMGGLIGVLGLGMNQFFLKDLAFYIGIVLVLFFAIGYAFPQNFPHLTLPIPQPLLKFLSNQSKSNGGNGSLSLALMMGGITGLLPCGLLFPGYALSLLAPSPWESSLVMVAFSLGTYPMLLGMSFFSAKLWGYFSQRKYRVLLAAFLVLFSLFTIYERVYGFSSDEECHTPPLTTIPVR